jgi:hypothetical protein
LLVFAVLIPLEGADHSDDLITIMTQRTRQYGDDAHRRSDVVIKAALGGGKFAVLTLQF